MEEKSKAIAVLFAMKDSIYKTFGECDVYDIDRNALTFKGGLPVIAHPPCRLWGRLAHLSSAPKGEKELAIWAVDQVRKNGGILEHPSSTRLWKEANLPQVGKIDSFGGWTLVVLQYWFGHRAEKKTRLYIVGVYPKDVPQIPLRLGRPEFTISSSKKKDKSPEVSSKERSATPKEFAIWLIEVAKKCKA